MLLRTSDPAPDLIWDRPLELSHTAQQLLRRAADEDVAEFVENAPRELPVVSVGRPITWPLAQLYPDDQVQPVIRARLAVEDFYLGRFYCSFRPQTERITVRAAQFTVELRSTDPAITPLVYDLDPRDVMQPLKRTRRVTLNPSVKFQEVEGSLGGVEFGLEYEDLQPVITAGGDGEPTAFWDYSAPPGRTIAGGKWMHALIRVPRGKTQVSARITVVADIDKEGALFSALLRRGRERTLVDALQVRLWKQD